MTEANQKFDFRFGNFIKHSEKLVEVIFNEGSSIGVEEMKDCNVFLREHFRQPYSVLVNTKNSFSFEFNALVIAGDSEFEKKVGFLIYRLTTERSLGAVEEIQKGSFPHKQLGFFRNRDEAIQWLSDI